MKNARASLTIISFTAGTLISGSALAFTAFTTAHLNLRAGPGPQYQVIATIGYNDKIEVDGCLKGVTWCDVIWGNTRGWAVAEYIAYDAPGEVVLLPGAASEIGIPLVTYKEVAAVVPQFVGEIETVSATDAVTEIITPPNNVNAFVEEQSVGTVYVSGEVVLGATLPKEVPLYAVPESGYEFTNVNGQNVLVEAGDRKVVHVYR